MGIDSDNDEEQELKNNDLESGIVDKSTKKSSEMSRIIVSNDDIKIRNRKGNVSEHSTSNHVKLDINGDSDSSISLPLINKNKEKKNSLQRFLDHFAESDDEEDDEAKLSKRMGDYNGSESHNDLTISTTSDSSSNSENGQMTQLQRALVNDM